MKTWEVLKELTNDPKKRFRLPNWEDGRYITAMGTGLIVNETHEPVNVSRLKVDWEMLPQEVTWQEAIESWANGDRVVSVNKAGGRVYRQGGDMHLYANEITNGKWYIL